MAATRLRYSAYGVASVAGLVLLVVLALMQFNRDFDSTDTLHVRTPRAGLLLDAGSPVKLRAPTIGRVEKVLATEDGARLDLALSPGQLHLVPANVGAHIVPPTMFG